MSELLGYFRLELYLIPVTILILFFIRGWNK